MHLYLEYLKNLIFGPISGPFWSKNLKIGSPPQKKYRSTLSLYATVTLLKNQKRSMN